MSDRLSLSELHKKCKMLSLKQRMEKQLLGLMYIISRESTYHRVPGRNTRSADKITFKIPSKIRPVYEPSPYYIGSKLWNLLTQGTQTREDIFAFKKDVSRLYEVYKKI